MRIDTSLALMPLQPGRPQRLLGARGARLRGVRGTTWVTIDHDRRDLVLESGESFVVDSSEPVVVSSLGGAALLEVAEPCAGTARP